MPPKVALKMGAWDKEEDGLLYYWQSMFGNKWSEVARYIPGRTGQQCAQRWRHKVNPNIRRDKWTREEDARLVDLVNTLGVGKWAEVARQMAGRTDQQCMGRWRRHLDPGVKRDSWRPEEDARLLELHAQHGTSWSRISQLLKGRTSQQCRARWHQIDSGRARRAGSGARGGGGAQGSSGGGRRRRGRGVPSFDSDESDDEGEGEGGAGSDADGGGCGVEGQDEEGPARGRKGGQRGALQEAALQLEVQQQWARGQGWRELGLGGEGTASFGPQASSAAAAAEAAAEAEAEAEAFKLPSQQPLPGPGGAAGGSVAGSRGAAAWASGDAVVLDGVAYAVRRRAAAAKPLPLQERREQQPPSAAAGPAAPAPASAWPNANRGGAAAAGPAYLGPPPGSPAAGAELHNLASPPVGARRLSVGGCYSADKPGGGLPRAQAAAAGARGDAGAPTGWQRLAGAEGFDADEAAGAETLLQMAAVLRGAGGRGAGPAGGGLAGAGAPPEPVQRAGAAAASRLSDDLSPAKGGPGLAKAPHGPAADAPAPDFWPRPAAADAADREPALLLAAGGGACGGGGARGGGRARSAGAAEGEGVGAGWASAKLEAGAPAGRRAPQLGAATCSSYDTDADDAAAEPDGGAAAADASGTGGASGAGQGPDQGFVAQLVRGVAEELSTGGEDPSAAVASANVDVHHTTAAGCDTPTSARQGRGRGRAHPAPAPRGPLLAAHEAPVAPFWSPHAEMRKAAAAAGTGGTAAPQLGRTPGQGAAAAAGGGAAAPGAAPQPARVARRLDQHEAWAAVASASAGSGGDGGGGGEGGGAEGQGGAGDMPSPLKRRRVPSDSGGRGPEGRGTDGGGGHEPSRLNPAAGKGWKAAAAAPGWRAWARPASWRVPPASALLMSPPRPPPPARAAGALSHARPGPPVAAPPSKLEEWPLQPEQMAGSHIRSFPLASATAVLPEPPALPKSFVAPRSARGAPPQSAAEARSRLHAMLEGLP